MTARVLTPRQLNRALLVRQLLIGRVDLSVPDALVRLAGLPAQDSSSAALALWARLRDFRRDALRGALENRSVARGTLMRGTPHLVAARDYWRFAAGTREARRRAAVVSAGGSPQRENEARDAADRVRTALAQGPKSVHELDGRGDGQLALAQRWEDIVRVPVAGKWGAPAEERLALAETWLGPDDASEADGRRHLVTAYLRAFGPASWGDISNWAGTPASELREAAADLALERYSDARGQELLDIPDEPLPDPDLPAPARLLPAGDATLLGHAEAAQVLPDELRPRILPARASVPMGTLLVDGTAAGQWRLVDAEVRVEAFRSLLPSEIDEVETERAALETFLTD